MAQSHIRQLRNIVIEWHQKAPEVNGDIAPYANGFVDGVKFTYQRLVEMGIALPDADIFTDEKEAR